MKITANRRDDIIKERDEYRAQYEENERKRAEESQKFREAEDAVFDPIREDIEYTLSKFPALEFHVYVGTRWGDKIEIQIKCNDRLVTRDESALSWDFTVRLTRDGEVIKETSSWSGLNATTEAHLKQLRQTVSVLEYLNDCDWKSILDKDLPKYEDYFKTPRVDNRENEFQKRIMEADLEDLIGTNKFVKVNNFESSGYRGRYIYIRIIRETPSQYVVNIATEWEIKNYSADDRDIANRWTQRVKKSNVRPVIEDGELVTLEI